MSQQGGADRERYGEGAETEEEMDRACEGACVCVCVCVCVCALCSLESTLEIAWEKDL